MMRYSTIRTILRALVLTGTLDVAYSAVVTYPLYLGHPSSLTTVQSTIVQPKFTTLKVEQTMSQDIKKMDLTYVSSINLSGCTNVNKIIEALVQNSTLSSLLSIDLSNTDISLNALRKLKQILPKLGFIRPMERVSSRFGHQVACIEVSISGTDLAKDPDSRWELNNDIQRPVERSVNTFYLATQEFGQAHLQIILSFTPLFVAAEADRPTTPLTDFAMAAVARAEPTTEQRVAEEHTGEIKLFDYLEVLARFRQYASSEKANIAESLADHLRNHDNLRNVVRQIGSRNVGVDVRTANSFIVNDRITQEGSITKMTNEILRQFSVATDPYNFLKEKCSSFVESLFKKWQEQSSKTTRGSEVQIPPLAELRPAGNSKQEQRAIEEQKSMEAETKHEKAAMIKIAHGMLAKKMEISLIAELTGLPEDEINELQ